MTRPPRPDWTAWPQGPPTASLQQHPLLTAGGGSIFEIGLLLGELRTEGRRQTEILLSMLAEQRELPDRLARRLTEIGSHPPAASPAPPTSPMAPPQDRLAQWAEILRSLWPLAFLAAVLAGKISVPDALPIIRHMIGGAA